MPILNIVIKLLGKYEYLPECRVELYYLYCFPKVKICEFGSGGFGEYFYLCI